MIESIKQVYDVTDTGDIGNLVILTVLLPDIEADNPSIVQAYQKAWDALPDRLIREFCDQNGVVT